MGRPSKPMTPPAGGNVGVPGENSGNGKKK